MANAGAIKGGQTYVEAYLENAPFMRGLASMERSLKAWGAKLTSYGAMATGAGAAMAAPLAASLKIFADMGGEIDDISQRTGITAGALSELAFAAQQGGTDLATLEGGAQKMLKFLAAADDGSKSAREAILALGFSLSELQAMTPDQQMIQLGKRIAEISDPAERTAKMMEVFGKSGVQLLPMMNDIDALAARARELGLTLEGEDVAAAAAFGDKMDELWAVLKKGAFTIGASLAPALDGIISFIVTGTSQIGKFIDANRGLVVMIGGVAAGLMAGGVALMGFGGILSLAGSAAGMVATVIGGIATAATTAGGIIVSVLGGALAFLASPLGLTVAAVAALAAGVLYFSGMGGDMMSGIVGGLTSVQEGAMSAFNTIREDGTKAFEGIKGALAAGDFALAAQILWDTIKLEWARGVGKVQQVWNEFVGWFQDAGMVALTGVMTLINDAWAGMELACLEVSNGIQAIWGGMTSFLTTTWNSTIGLIQKAWVRVKALFDSGINVEAELKKIDDETTAKNFKVNQAQADAAAQREAETQFKRDQIGQTRDGANQELQRALQESIMATAEANDAALRKAEEDIAAAQKKFDEAVAAGQAAEQAMKDRAEAEYELFGGKNPGTPDADPSGSEGKITTTATFDPAVAARLGAGNGMAERTAKATERTAESNEEIKEGVQKLVDKKPEQPAYAP